MNLTINLLWPIFPVKEKGYKKTVEAGYGGIKSKVVVDNG